MRKEKEIGRKKKKKKKHEGEREEKNTKGMEEKDNIKKRRC